MNLDATDKSLYSPLYLRAASGFGLKVFINSGANINAKTAIGQTALDLASGKAHLEPVLHLLESGATTHEGVALNQNNIYIQQTV